MTLKLPSITINLYKIINFSNSLNSKENISIKRKNWWTGRFYKRKYAHYWSKIVYTKATK